MKWLRHHLPAYIIASIFAGVATFDKALAMDQEQKPEERSMSTGQMTLIIDTTHQDPIEGTRVSTALSLENGCLHRISNAFTEADQFILIFVHAFNSSTLNKALEAKLIENVPVIMFLDQHTASKPDHTGSKPSSLVNRLNYIVPTTFLNAGDRHFNHRIIIVKKSGEQAIVMLGSADSLFCSTYHDSQDLLFIQSNRLASYLMGALYNQIQQMLLEGSSTERASHQTTPKTYEYRAMRGKTNLELLGDLKGLLAIDDKLTLEGIPSYAVSYSVSPVLSRNDSTPSYMDILTWVLTNPSNQLLILFGNLLQLNEDVIPEEVKEFLNTNTPKLIVLNKNQYTGTSVETIRGHKNTVLLFSPYTGGAFDHNLIIQYIQNGDPIVYAGSFQLEGSSQPKDTKSIVGIRSKQLADQILSAILSNSGLGDVPSVWRFLMYFQQFGMEFKGTQKEQVAKRIHFMCQRNMERYLDRLDRIQHELATCGGEAQQVDLGSYFEQFVRDFNTANETKKIEAIKNLKFNIFSDHLQQTFIKALCAKWGTLNSQVPNLPALPCFTEGRLDEWLDQVRLWLENVKKVLKLDEEEHNDEIKDMTFIWAGINNLNDYEYRFTNFYELTQALNSLLG